MIAMFTLLAHLTRIRFEEFLNFGIRNSNENFFMHSFLHEEPHISFLFTYIYGFKFGYASFLIIIIISIVEHKKKNSFCWWSTRNVKRCTNKRQVHLEFTFFCVVLKNHSQENHWTETFQEWRTKKLLFLVHKKRAVSFYLKFFPVSLILAMWSLGTYKLNVELSIFFVVLLLWWNFFYAFKMKLFHLLQPRWTIFFSL